MLSLPFNIPFTGFSHHSFFSAAAAVHTYFTHPNAPTEYKNGWDYHITPGGMQEDWYFVLGTMSGNNSLMDNFDDSIDNPDADTAYCDFCMKFLGYRYTVAESGFADALQKSIKQGNPAIALLKDRSDGRNCFVLIGYDEEKPIAADHSGAQGDNTPPAYDEIEKLYVITDKCAPEYTLIDGLRNVERSLVSVLDGGIWDDLRSREEWSFLSRRHQTNRIPHTISTVCRNRCIFVLPARKMFRRRRSRRTNAVYGNCSV